MKINKFSINIDDLCKIYFEKNINMRAFYNELY